VRPGKRLRRWAAARSIDLAAAIVPWLYVAYMWLVEVTSRHEEGLRELMLGCLERHDRAVGMLWHQEVFSVAYNYRHYRPHTLASISDFGEVITAMLERCNFVVFRGGSGSRSRRRSLVLEEMIDHMRASPRVVYGITVDGSQGPAFRVKPGAAAIARACGAPVVVVRTWYRRGFTLKTWDRTQIPLPFNRRVVLASGPYWIPPEADEAALRAFTAHLEEELLELTARAYEAQGTVSRDAYRDFPPDWRSRWTPGTVGRKFGPYDLDPQHPPPWAHRRGMSNYADTAAGGAAPTASAIS
jgi:lysophospholipid acyltransferase (LPLAT)-like uncharacterized protein